MTINRTLVLLDKSIQFDELDTILSNDALIISIDFETHVKLRERNISHQLLDDYLQKKERKELYDNVLSKYNWYENLSKKSDYEFNDVSILSLMSPLEFHEFLLSILIKFISIKNCLEKNRPDKIFLSEKFVEYTKSIQSNIEIIVIRSKSNIEKGFLTEKIEVRFNLFSKPVTFYVSKRTYSSLKAKYENLICKLNNIWLDKKIKKEIILLVEFNIENYHELIKILSKSKKQLVLLNRRRSAVLTKNSIDILKSNDIKILDHKRFSSRNREFHTQKRRLSKNLSDLWDSDECNSLFSINSTTYWHIIKNRLKKIFEYRLDDYLEFVFESKQFLHDLKIDKIIFLSESGETENTLLQNSKNDVDTILLQHSFLRYHTELNDLQWRYEDQHMIGLKSKKLFVWGTNDLDYFLKQSLIEKEKIIVSGSPRHDNFYKIKNTSTEKSILITLSPISERSGLGDINLIIKYNQFLDDVINSIKKITNSKIIIKLHPGENPHNSILLEHLKNISGITVFQTKNSKDLIADCDLLINISPEFYDSSTIMLEGLLLRKPVFQLILDDEFNVITPLDLPIIQIQKLNDFNTNLRKFFHNGELAEILTEKIPAGLNNYLSYSDSSCLRILKLIENDT